MSAPAPDDNPNASASASAAAAAPSAADADAAAEPESINPEELAAAEAYLGRDNFIKMHKPQLMGMKLPPALINVLYAKLLAEQFDAAEAFEVQYVEGEEDEDEEVDEDEERGFRLVCKKEEGLKAGKDVWLIDHMWTTSPETALTQLKTIDGLVDRLWALADMDWRLEQQRRARQKARIAAREEKKKKATEAKAEVREEAKEDGAAPTPTVDASVPVSAAGSAASASAAAAAPSAAASAPSSLDLDEDSLCAIMSEAHVSRSRAEEAYVANKGDLIASITWCAGDSEREKAMKEHMTQIAEQQAAAQGHGAGAAEAAEDDENDAAADDWVPFDSSSLSLEAKASLLWPSLFRLGLVGSYFTTILNDVSSATLNASPSSVQTALFVNDEIGSAVQQVPEGSGKVNAIMAPLVCVTLGGVAFSLLWLTKDVEEGEEIFIATRPPIRLPGVPATE